MDVEAKDNISWDTCGISEIEETYLYFLPIYDLVPGIPRPPSLDQHRVIEQLWFYEELWLIHHVCQHQDYRTA